MYFVTGKIFSKSQTLWQPASMYPFVDDPEVILELTKMAFGQSIVTKVVCIPPGCDWLETPHTANITKLIYEVLE